MGYICFSGYFVLCCIGFWGGQRGRKWKEGKDCAREGGSENEVEFSSFEV